MPRTSVMQNNHLIVSIACPSILAYKIANFLCFISERVQILFGFVCVIWITIREVFALYSGIIDDSLCALVLGQIGTSKMSVTLATFK